MLSALLVNAYVRLVENGSLVNDENLGGFPGPFAGVASKIVRLFTNPSFCLLPIDFSFEKLPSSIILALPSLAGHNRQLPYTFYYRTLWVVAFLDCI